MHQRICINGCKSYFYPFNQIAPLTHRMRSFLIVTMLWFILCPSRSSGQVNLSQGLVAYYPFTGHAYDASGNGNHTVFNNATLTTDRFGNPNSAYLFNGQNTYM